MYPAFLDYFVRKIIFPTLSKNASITLKTSRYLIGIRVLHFYLPRLLKINKHNHHFYSNQEMFPPILFPCPYRLAQDWILFPQQIEKFLFQRNSFPSVLLFFLMLYFQFYFVLRIQQNKLLENLHLYSKSL